MPNAQDVYMVNVHPLPPVERLRVAALILDELTRAAPLAVEESTEWNEEDIRDLTAFSLQYAASLYPEEEEYA